MQTAGGAGQLNPSPEFYSQSFALYSWSVLWPSTPYCGLPAEYSFPLHTHMVNSAPQAAWVQPVTLASSGCSSSSAAHSRRD